MILGVSFDTAAENKKFAEKFSFNFPLICDTDRKIGTAYGANADPQKGAQRVGVVIDGEGNVARAILGVKPDDHAEKVLAALP